MDDLLVVALVGILAKEDVVFHRVVENPGLLGHVGHLALNTVQKKGGIIITVLVPLSIKEQVMTIIIERISRLQIL